MPALILFALIICSSAQSLFAKLYSEKTSVQPSAAPAVFNFWYSIIIAAGSFAFAGFSVHASGLTFLFASAAAAATTVYNISIVSAAQSGPYPVYMISALFGGIILPTAVGTAVFGDKPSVTVIIGAVLMLAAVAMLAAKGSAGRLSGKFIRSCVALFVSNGVFGTAFALQARYVDGEDAAFVLIAFGFSAVATLAVIFATRKKEKPLILAPDLRGGIFLFISAAGSCVAQQLNLLVLTLLPSAVVFPTHCGCVLVAVSLFSIFIFKEKLSKLRWAGVAVSAASMVLLSL